MAKKIIATLADSTLFLREWIVNPQRTGSVAPSSPQLSAAMAQWLPKNSEDYVLELGPGTGPVTDALLKNGLREDRLIAIEHNPTMAKLLHKRFPRAHIITGDAWQMDTLLAELPQSVTAVGAVISSLPLVNFKADQAEALGQKIRSLLVPNGKWVQYSYQIHKRRSRGSSSFKLHASKVVWFNLPPARVSVFQK
ncbi:MAG TPA: methyltransferase domain-containing protein [Verrucomicrobiae bacterium]|jgi:phosphatidylethanolamine/phosphatidyl-N-methylethanolamine N-methyltransferase